MNRHKQEEKGKIRVKGQAKLRTRVVRQQGNKSRRTRQRDWSEEREVDSESRSNEKTERDKDVVKRHTGYTEEER